LVMRGDSCTGKTQRAVALFGWQCTLRCNCQGVGEDLPSLRSFDEETHRAILFDEIDVQQVLKNRLLFQSPEVPYSLGQSRCGQHEYQVNVHAVAMILCTNVFDFSAGSSLSVADAQWLTANCMVAELPVDQKWYT